MDIEANPNEMLYIQLDHISHKPARIIPLPLNRLTRRIKENHAVVIKLLSKDALRIREALILLRFSAFVHHSHSIDDTLFSFQLQLLINILYFYFLFSKFSFVSLLFLRPKRDFSFFSSFMISQSASFLSPILTDVSQLPRMLRA